jgi:hypothetical protein
MVEKLGAGGKSRGGLGNDEVTNSEAERSLSILNTTGERRSLEALGGILELVWRS